MGIVASPNAIAANFSGKTGFFDYCKALLKEQYEDYNFLLEIPFNALSTVKNIHGKRI